MGKNLHHDKNMPYYSNLQWKLVSRVVIILLSSFLCLVPMKSTLAEDTKEFKTKEAQETEEAETEESPKDMMLLHDADGWTIRSHLQFGANVVSERNLFWNFADTFAPDADFDSDTDWLELYLKPGLSFTYELNDRGVFYGMGSAVVSGTLGTDAYDTGDTGRVTLEEGYLGFRSTNIDGINFDFSVGPRQLLLGTGMLIANGASSGFERGALKFGLEKHGNFLLLGVSPTRHLLAPYFILTPTNYLPTTATPG